MFNTFTIYINNEEDLEQCQKILFKEGYKWRKSTSNEICKLTLPVYLFINDGIITWTDDDSSVYNFTSTTFSYKEYLKFRNV